MIEELVKVLVAADPPLTTYEAIGALEAVKAAILSTAGNKGEGSGGDMGNN